jgi:hypothetical protein
MSEQGSDFLKDHVMVIPVTMPSPRARCRECGRVFDLADEDDAAEWAYGHDCEES